MKMMKCPGCGVVKDQEKLEVYSHPESNRLVRKPIPPLLEIDTDISTGDGRSLRVFVCHECFHRLDPDMWIDDACWEILESNVSYDSLKDYNYYPETQS